MVCCIMALQAGEEKGTVEDHVRILVLLLLLLSCLIYVLRMLGPPSYFFFCFLYLLYFTLLLYIYCKSISDLAWQRREGNSRRPCAYSRPSQN